MPPLQRPALRCARRLRCPHRPQTRRYADHAKHDSTGHAGPHGEVHEGFSRSFWIGLASIPAALALYKLSRSDESSRPLFTRLIEQYRERLEIISERNDLHTKMVERAGADRNIFNGARPNAHIDLKFPEGFDASSPYNVPAGHGSINLDKVIAHYEKKNYEENERKLRELKDGTLEKKLNEMPSITKAAPTNTSM